MTGTRSNSSFDRELTDDNFSNMADSLNTTLGGLLLGDNFGGQIIGNIKIPVGEEVKISHNLKVVPKYRIILRQDGATSISDGSIWNDKYISLRAGNPDGFFLKDIVAQEKAVDWIESADGAPCDAGNYSATGAVIDPRKILLEKECLNAAFSGITGEEVTITILLMRG